MLGKCTLEGISAVQNTGVIRNGSDMIVIVAYEDSRCKMGKMKSLDKATDYSAN